MWNVKRFFWKSNSKRHKSDSFSLLRSGQCWARSGKKIYDMKTMLLRVKHFMRIHGITQPAIFIDTFLRKKKLAKLFISYICIHFFQFTSFLLLAMNNHTDEYQTVDYTTVSTIAVVSSTDIYLELIQVLQVSDCWNNLTNNDPEIFSWGKRKHIQFRPSQLSSSWLWMWRTNTLEKHKSRYSLLFTWTRNKGDYMKHS